jgi:hypothetical protein
MTLTVGQSGRPTRDWCEGEWIEMIRNAYIVTMADCSARILGPMKAGRQEYISSASGEKHHESIRPKLDQLVMFR